MPRKSNPNSDAATAAANRQAGLDYLDSKYGDGEDVVSVMFRNAVQTDHEIHDLYATRQNLRLSLRAFALAGACPLEDVNLIYPARKPGATDDE